MSGGKRKHRIGRWLSAGTLLVAVLALSQVAAVAAAGREIKGTIAMQPVAGPACLSPVGWCASGTLSGRLKGAYQFTATSLIQTVDTPTTGVLLYTGDAAIQTAGGNLLLKSAGALFVRLNVSACPASFAGPALIAVAQFATVCGPALSSTL